MFSFIAKTLTGGLGTIWNYLIIGGLVLAILGFGYWQFTSNIAEKAQLQFRVDQLQQILKNKDETIDLLEFTMKLNNQAIQENLSTIEKLKSKNDSVQETLAHRPDANNASSEFLKEYFRMKANQ